MSHSSELFSRIAAQKWISTHHWATQLHWLITRKTGHWSLSKSQIYRPAVNTPAECQMCINLPLKVVPNRTTVYCCVGNIWLKLQCPAVARNNLASFESTIFGFACFFFWGFFWRFTFSLETNRLRDQRLKPAGGYFLFFCRTYWQ